MTAGLQTVRQGDADEQLAHWTLSDLYASPDAPEITADLDWARAGQSGSTPPLPAGSAN